MKRIMLLVTAASVMAVMIAGYTVPAAAKSQVPCGLDAVVGVHPLTGEPGCVADAIEPFPGAFGCPLGTEIVTGAPTPTCFGPFIDVTKEECKEQDFVFPGFRNQGQCVKAANHPVE